MEKAKFERETPMMIPTNSTNLEGGDGYSGRSGFPAGYEYLFNSVVKTIINTKSVGCEIGEKRDENEFVMSKPVVLLLPEFDISIHIGGTYSEKDTETNKPSYMGRTNFERTPPIKVPANYFISPNYTYSGGGSGYPGGNGYPGGGRYPGGDRYPGGNEYSGVGGYPDVGGYPGGGGYPGASGYPGGGGYPGASGYPGGGGYPGASGYPGGGGYPGASGYPGGGGYPGGSVYPGGGGYPGGSGNPGGGEHRSEDKDRSSGGAGGTIYSGGGGLIPAIVNTKPVGCEIGEKRDDNGMCRPVVY
ncbi:hypothetical protein M0804_011513 [Polistes exclamans]|nr:hypothetical protein M0804_011513 [Polistes exclamans]